MNETERIERASLLLRAMTAQQQGEITPAQYNELRTELGLPSKQTKWEEMNGAELRELRAALRAVVAECKERARVFAQGRAAAQGFLTDNYSEVGQATLHGWQTAVADHEWFLAVLLGHEAIARALKEDA